MITTTYLLFIYEQLKAAFKWNVHSHPPLGGESHRKWSEIMTDDKKNQGLSETDLASERMGSNKLQGDDQANVQNERKAVPDVKKETDGVIESFEKRDKDQRAREDLGKGNRTS